VLPTTDWRCSSRGSAGESPTTPLVGRSGRRDFQRQYSLKPARCQRITVSGRTIASASYILGNSRQIAPNISLSIDANRSLLGLARRSTLICCLSIKISASSVARDRRRSITVPKISLHKSNIEQQHRPILGQLPADWIYDRDSDQPLPALVAHLRGKSILIVLDNCEHMLDPVAVLAEALLPIVVIPEDQFLTPSRHARLPDVVKCVPLSVSTLWILNGTAVTRRRRKSAAVLRATFSCTSTKANLEGAVDRDEQVDLALRGSNFG
jgi:hypothetical protein